MKCTSFTATSGSAYPFDSILLKPCQRYSVRAIVTITTIRFLTVSKKVTYKAIFPLISSTLFRLTIEVSL